MEDKFERLKLEVEEERKRLYLERFGELHGMKEKEIKLSDFN